MSYVGNFLTSNSKLTSYNTQDMSVKALLVSDQKGLYLEWVLGYSETAIIVTGILSPPILHLPILGSPMHS